LNEADLWPALGWRHRRHYDMRATFITLASEDGADAETLETRVTQYRKSRSAFDGYNRGLHWERTCAEIAKLDIKRAARPDPGGEASIASGESIEIASIASGERPEVARVQRDQWLG
jgi:hypothetical protein